MIDLIDIEHSLRRQYEVTVNLSCPKEDDQTDSYVPKWYTNAPMPYIDSIDESGLAQTDSQKLNR